MHPRADTYQVNVHNAGRNERPPSFPKTRRSLFGDDDLALAGALDGAGAAAFVDGEINCGHFGKLLGGKGEVV